MSFYAIKLFKIRIVLFGFLLLLSLNLSPYKYAQDKVTQEVNSVYKEAAKNFYRLYDDSSFRKYKNNWLNTIKQFHAIYLKYPQTIRAVQSLYNIGKLYRSLYKWNRLPLYIDRSNKNFELLTNRYADSYLADDSLYEIGLNYIEILKNKKKALKYFQLMLDRYPSSEYAESASGYFDNPSVKSVTPINENSKNKNKIAGETVISSIEDKNSKNKIISTSSSEQVYVKTKVKKIERWTTLDWSRVVIVTAKPARYKYNTLTVDADNPRFYVDILKSSLVPGLANKIVANDGIIKQLRVSQFDKDTVRVVLDLENYSNIKIFTFEFSDNFKIVLDVLSISPNKKSKKIRPDTIAKNLKPVPPVNPAPTPKTTYPGSDLSLQKILGLKIDRIIIDPGHGGKDPGAKNGKYLEKNITLKLALILKRLLEQKMENIEVLLTRERDIFIPLEARTAFANKNKGDMFISLHVNSHMEKKVRGIETYFLNLTDDKESLQLAALENKSTMKNVSDLQSILNDLMINNKLKESHDLGKEVNSNIYSYVSRSSGKTFSNRGVKQAPFVVLLGANMPSILIEVGFISNNNDLKNLLSKKYLNKLAEGIYKGISSHISKYNL